MVHPDAQRIMENLEDNRQWFASQLPPDSPSSDEAQPVGQESVIVESEDHAPKANESDGDEPPPGRVAASPPGSCRPDGWEAGETGAAEEDDEEEEEEDRTISDSRGRQAAGRTRAQSGQQAASPPSGSPSLQSIHPEIADVSRRESELSCTIQQQAASLQLCKPRAITQDLAPKPVGADGLQVQAERIQFQITLDEPEPEMMTHTSGGSQRRSKDSA